MNLKKKIRYEKTLVNHKRKIIINNYSNFGNKTEYIKSVNKN